jgi:sulfonate transport system substrate-binding protein
MFAWLILLQTALTVSVAGPASAPEYLPLRVAAAERYFADESIQVTLRDTRSPADAAEDLSRGHVELAATSLGAALRLGHVDGRPPRLVMGLTAAPPVALLVPAKLRETVREPKDLIGRTLGIPAPGGPEHGALLSILHGASIPVKRVRIDSFGNHGLAAAISAGSVGAGVLGDPAASRLLETGSAAALVDFRQPPVAERWLGGATVHAALFLRDGSGLRATELGPFTRAVARALTRLKQGDPDDLARLLPPEIVGLPEDFVARVQGARQLYLTGERVDPRRMARSLAAIRERWPLPVALKLPGDPAGLLFPWPTR